MFHGDILGERARLSPDRPVLVCSESGEQLSYRGLDRRAERLARLWRDGLGLAAEERIAILAENRVEVVESFFAAGKADVALVLLDPHLDATELEAILRNSQARTVIYGTETAPLVAEHGARWPVSRWLALDEPVGDGHVALTDLAVTAAHPGRPLGPAPAAHVRCILLERDACGRQRMVSHDNGRVVWNACNTALCWQLGERDAVPIFAPLHRSEGVGLLAPVVAAGGTIVLERQFAVEAVLAAASRGHCTVLHAAPDQLEQLLPALGEPILPSLRWAICEMGAVGPDLVERFAELGVVLRAGFGLGQPRLACSCFAMNDGEAWRKRGSIGRPALFCAARVLDAAGHELAADRVGELAVRPSFEGDWLRTGAQVRRDEEGFYFPLAGLAAGELRPATTGAAGRRRSARPR